MAVGRKRMGDIHGTSSPIICAGNGDIQDFSRFIRTDNIVGSARFDNGDISGHGFDFRDFRKPDYIQNSGVIP